MTRPEKLARFAEPKQALRELFSRITFNICVGNTDDHARDHAAFWDGMTLTLTPVYDICPQPRSGGVATQAMAIRRDGYRYSQLAGCAAASDTYLLSKNEAKDIIDHQVATIRAEWDEAADVTRLTYIQRNQLWGRQTLNPTLLRTLPEPRRTERSAGGGTCRSSSRSLQCILGPAGQGSSFGDVNEELHGCENDARVRQSGQGVR